MSGQARKNLPHHGGQVLAGVTKDVTIPFYSSADVLPLMDPTLAARGLALEAYRELLRDARVRTVLGKRKAKVTRREWIVEPASEAPRDAEIAEAVRAMLATLDFDRICERLLDAQLFGYAVAEIIWGRNRNGLIAPLRILSRRPERFVFDKDWRPRLLTPAQPVNGEPLPERKFIVHRFEAEDSNPYGLGLGSTLYWHVLFKREGVSFWMHFLEKFTSPTPVAKYAQGTPDAEVHKLVQALRDLVQRGVLAVPIGTELELLEAKRAGEAGYEAWCRYWDEQTAEVVLGSTLSTNIGSTGSKAAAETHAEESEIVADKDADELANTINSQLIRWIVELNWPDAAAPLIRWPRPRNALAEEEVETARAKRRQEQLAALAQLKRLGWRAANEQELLADVMGAQVAPAASGGDGGGESVSGAPQFAAADGARDPVVDHLTDQLAELAGPIVDGWADSVRERLRRHADDNGGWEGAANAALSAWPDMQVDAMGRIFGDALALAGLAGRGEVIEKTGINPFRRAPDGSKKKP